MATYSDYKISNYDDFFTREEEWIQISKFVPHKKVISMPFYSPHSKCNELLGKHIDNKIIYKNEDFFEFDRGDIVVDNPPFSKKKKIILKLVERNKPFMLIVPISTIAYNYAKVLKKHLQLLIFKSRPKYIKCNTKTGKLNTNNKKNPAFDSCVICWKMNLKNDINFL